MATKKQLAALRKARAAKKRKKEGLNGVVSSAVDTSKSILSTNPKAVKIVVGALGAGVVFLIGRKIYRALQEGAKSRAFTKAVERQVNRANLTINDDEAVGLAKSLLEAMNKSGTDEEAIDKVFAKIKTSDDFLLVSSKFGEEPYSRFWGKKTSGSTSLSLIGWLRAELKGKRLKTIENLLDSWDIKM